MEETEYLIPIRNKDGIVAYSKVDKDDYEKYGKLNWNLKNGYAASGMRGSLHRFIMNANIGDPFVDHINNDRLDNRKCNLRFVTNSLNSQNKKKKENTSSKYIGVSYNKKMKKWTSNLTCNGTAYQYSFDKENHAAYWYDQLALKYYGQQANINGIEKPGDFAEPKKKVTKNKYTGIYQNKNGAYRTYISNNGRKFIGQFDTEEEALDVYNRKKKELKEKEIEEILSKEILRNNNDNAIIELFNSKKEKTGECMVDDDKYYELIKNKWHMKKDGYVSTSKSILIHRLLMNAKKNEIVDHINGNKLDNRLSNLRISSPTLNGHNKLKKEGTTSKYIGVSKYGKKYTAVITKEKKYYYLGTFASEEDAARARDRKAIELYGEYAKLNFTVQ